MLPNYYGYRLADNCPRPCPNTEQVFALLRASMNKAALEYGRNRIT